MSDDTLESVKKALYEAMYAPFTKWEKETDKNVRAVVERAALAAIAAYEMSDEIKRLREAVR